MKHVYMRSAVSKKHLAGGYRLQPRVASRWKLLAAALLVAVILGLGFAFLRTPESRSDSKSTGSTNDTAVSIRSGLNTLADLLAMSPEALEGVDIGLMNLLCAEGLRGAESIDIREHLARLEGIAKNVEFQTERHLYKFRNNPEEYNRSEGYFRMLMMAVTLQEDFHMRYNPERIRQVGEFEPNEVFFADSRDIFIHGLVADDRRTGTCSSMPVLYVAIGRRLGYPLKLVPAQNHLFVRWEGSRERFNVDATGQGMNLYDDDHYRLWPVPMSPEDEHAFGYLKSMTTRVELTTFLALRGHCLMAMGRLNDGVAMHEQALRYSPESRLQQVILATAREHAQPQRAAFDYLPPEQRPNWPQPRRVNYQQRNVSGLDSVIPADPNPLNRIRNQ